MTLKYIKHSILTFCFIMLWSCINNEKNTTMKLTWNNDLNLPPCVNMDVNVGLAGAYAGILENELVIVGGANFPVGFPWTNGIKTWWKTLYCKDILTAENSEWIVNEDFLPIPMGYGVSIQLPEELLMIGGCDKEKCYADVLSLEKTDGIFVLKTDKYPALPIPLANASGVLLDNTIYIMGGQETMLQEKSSSYFFMLDLNNISEGWKKLESWDGPSRAYAVSVVQAGKVYLFSGRSFGPDQKTVMHTDGYCYNPQINEWQALEGEFPVMAGTAIASGVNTILFCGGVREILPTTPQHPGFSNEVWALDTATNAFRKAAESPYPIAVTTTLVSRDSVFYIASGEIRPGIRTPHILKGTILDK